MDYEDNKELVVGKTYAVTVDWGFGSVEFTSKFLGFHTLRNGEPDYYYTRWEGGITVSHESALNANEVAPVKTELNQAEAIFAFVGWLSALNGEVVIGAEHEPGKVIRLISQYCKSQGWEAGPDDWGKLIKKVDADYYGYPRFEVKDPYPTKMMPQLNKPMPYEQPLLLCEWCLHYLHGDKVCNFNQCKCESSLPQKERAK